MRAGYMACNLAERPVVPTSMFKPLIGCENLDCPTIPLSDELGSDGNIGSGLLDFISTFIIGLSQSIE